jgi:hypothetical protein
MREICISRTAQLLTGAAVVAGMGAAVAAQMPEIQRYLKIRKM